MTIKNNKLKDLTPLTVTFSSGESPTPEKLKGMMDQVETALEYLELIIGDVCGESSTFTTWLGSIGRDLGDRSELGPFIQPNVVVDNYHQELLSGKTIHELDMFPLGELEDLILTSTDSSVVPGQFKTSISQLAVPGDWTIPSGITESGEIKRKRILATHAPSTGGQIIFKKVTSGRGSSLYSSSENIIPSISQMENLGPFLTIELADKLTNVYLVTLPLRSKMDGYIEGSSENFSATRMASSVGLGTQYELPPIFFDSRKLDLLSDGEDGSNKSIPLNLVHIYDWKTKKRVEGIISVKTATDISLRKVQLIVQYKPDVLLDVDAGAYALVVPGNSVTQQLKALSHAVFDNKRDGSDFQHLISHKDLLDLRTAVDFGNRSTFYGPSIIPGNDHSMYLHRNGYTESDIGGGGNILRGDFIIGNTLLGDNDQIHEHYNVLNDSFKLAFGTKEKGPSLRYKKVVSHDLPRAKNGLPLVWTDNALVLQGPIADADPSVRNIILDGDVRSTGDVVLGGNKNDTVFLQGKAYVNEELTYVPIQKGTRTIEEGKTIYDPDEKAVVFCNGVAFVSPWKATGFGTVIGDGQTTFGKYNGTDITPFTKAIAELASTGGTIKILPGSYNFQYNELVVPANITIEGAGIVTIINGNANCFNLGVGSRVENLKIVCAKVGVILTGNYSSIDSLVISSSEDYAISVVGERCIIGSNITIDQSMRLISAPTSNKGKRALTSNAGLLLPYSAGGLDWTDKALLFKEFTGESSTGFSFDSTATSGFGGIGAFKATGTGAIYTNKLLPISPTQGVGGHINIAAISGTAQVSVGAKCYNQNGSYIEDRWFICGTTAITATTLSESFFNGISSYPHNLSSSIKFVRPCIQIYSNPGGIVFDGLNVWSLGYARATIWS